jgi:hypothetical protein
MEKWTKIRRDILVEEMSRREACRKYNLNFLYSDIYFSPPTTIRIPRRGRRARRENLVGCWRMCRDLIGSQRGSGALGFLRG